MDASGVAPRPSVDSALRDLPLRGFRPRSFLRVEEHPVARARFPRLERIIESIEAVVAVLRKVYRENAARLVPGLA